MKRSLFILATLVASFLFIGATEQIVNEKSNCPYLQSIKEGSASKECPYSLKMKENVEKSDCPYLKKMKEMGKDSKSSSDKVCPFSGKTKQSIENKKIHSKNLKST
jgi:hypothetical protein